MVLPRTGRKEKEMKLIHFQILISLITLVLLASNIVHHW